MGIENSVRDAVRLPFVREDKDVVLHTVKDKVDYLASWIATFRSLNETIVYLSQTLTHILYDFKVMNKEGEIIHNSGCGQYEGLLPSDSGGKMLPGTGPLGHTIPFSTFIGDLIFMNEAFHLKEEAVNPNYESAVGYIETEMAQYVYALKRDRLIGRDAAEYFVHRIREGCGLTSHNLESVDHDPAKGLDFYFSFERF